MSFARHPSEALHNSEAGQAGIQRLSVAKALDDQLRCCKAPPAFAGMTAGNC
jgi:hypothetical protein